MKERAAHPRPLCSRFHRASELIGKRWTGAIIFLLMESRCRFATLRKEIPEITDRMLSERLSELEGVLGQSLDVSEEGHFMGALGAALFALERAEAAARGDGAPAMAGAGADPAPTGGGR